MPAAASRSNATVVLAALAAGQFVMALDSSVMNVSIPVVAADVGTDVTGIQTAITMYTLVMAAFMITGGKVGAIIGRKRAFTIGCVIYACGSLTTALSQTLPMLMFTLFQKRLLGSLYGEANPRADIPRLLSLYREGKLLLDEAVTTEYKLNDINEAYDDMLAGRNIRGVVIHDH